LGDVSGNKRVSPRTEKSARTDKIQIKTGGGGGQRFGENEKSANATEKK